MARYESEDGDPIVVIERHSAGVTPFLIGIALGAGVALLMAPRSGAATRRDLTQRARRAQRAAKRAVSEVADSVSGTFEDARQKVEDRLDSAREAIDVKRRQVRRAMDAGRDAAREARTELEQRLTETKAAYSAGAAVAHDRRARAQDAEDAEDAE